VGLLYLLLQVEGVAATRRLSAAGISGGVLSTRKKAERRVPMKVKTNVKARGDGMTVPIP